MINVLKTIARATSKVGQNSVSLYNVVRSYSAMNDLTKPEIKRLTNIFNKIDTNGDGYISRDEFGEAMKKSFDNVSNRMIDEVMTKIPDDPEQKVSLEQFLNSIAPAMLLKNMIEGVVQLSFDIVDADNDGKISKEETREMLKMIGQTPDDDKINRIMNNYDKDKDGNLTLREFNDYLWIELARS